MASRRITNVNRNYLSGVFVSIGDLLGIKQLKGKFIPKVMARTTWKDEKNRILRSGLSYGAFLIHVEESKSDISDVKIISKLAKAIANAADQQPSKFLKILNAFQTPPSKQDQKEVVETAKELKLVDGNSPDFYAFLPLLVIGAIILMSGCPVNECGTDGPGCGEDTGGSTG